jgi:hypothetical protein
VALAIDGEGADASTGLAGIGMACMRVVGRASAAPHSMTALMISILAAYMFHTRLFHNRKTRESSSLPAVIPGNRPPISLRNNKSPQRPGYNRTIMDVLEKENQGTILFCVREPVVAYFHKADAKRLR